jgi:hypothetical protein
MSEQWLEKTESVKVKSEKVTKENIIGRIDYKKTRDEPKQTKVVISPENKIDAPKKARHDTLVTARTDWNSLRSQNVSVRNAAIKKIVKLFNGPDYKVQGEPLYNKDGSIRAIRIWELGDNGQPETPIREIESEQDVFSIYTPKDKKGSEYVDYDAAIKEEPLFNNH